MDWLRRPERPGTFRGLKRKRKPLGWRALAPCVTCPHLETDRREAKQLRMCLLSKREPRYEDKSESRSRGLSKHAPRHLPPTFVFQSRSISPRTSQFDTFHLGTIISFTTAATQAAHPAGAGTQPTNPLEPSWSRTQHPEAGALASRRRMGHTHPRSQNPPGPRAYPRASRRAGRLGTSLRPWRRP